MILADDVAVILRILADGGPMSTGRIALLVNPYPWRGSRDDYERMREIRTWGRRDGEVWTAVGRLVDQGLVDGPWGARRITGAGREELARATDAEGGDVS